MLVVLSRGDRLRDYECAQGQRDWHSPGKVLHFVIFFFKAYQI